MTNRQRICPPHRPYRACLPGLLIAAALLGGGVTAAERHVTALRIAAHDAHYTLGRSAFGDLDALADVVAAATPRSMELHACGPGSHRALLAAVHRFSHLPLTLRLSGADDAVCAAPSLAVRVGQQGSPGPTGIDEAAVARYWRQVMP